MRLLCLLRRFWVEGALTNVRATDTGGLRAETKVHIRGRGVRGPSRGVAFGGVDGGLQENFEAFDRDAGAGFEAFEDRG